MFNVCCVVAVSYQCCIFCVLSLTESAFVHYNLAEYCLR